VRIQPCGLLKAGGVILAQRPDGAWGQAIHLAQRLVGQAQNLGRRLTAHLLPLQHMAQRLAPHIGQQAQKQQPLTVS
jgi:hypothetical protein